MSQSKLPSGEYLTAFYAGGCTLEEIGAAYGVTRERVRQKLPAGERVPRSCNDTRRDPRRIMQAIRHPGTRSLYQAMHMTGSSRDAIVNVLKALELLEAVRRLMRWRQKRMPPAPRAYKRTVTPAERDARRECTRAWWASLTAEQLEEQRAKQRQSRPRKNSKREKG